MGFYDEGKKTGHGTFEYPDGSKYEGMYSYFLESFQLRQEKPVYVLKLSEIDALYNSFLACQNACFWLFLFENL